MKINKQIIMSQSEKDTLSNLYEIYENSSSLYNELSFGEFVESIINESIVTDYGYDIVIE